MKTIKSIKDLNVNLIKLVTNTIEIKGGTGGGAAKPQTSPTRPLTGM